MDEEVEHVVPLPADLQSRLDPIHPRRLEELGRLDCEFRKHGLAPSKAKKQEKERGRTLTEEVLLRLRLGRTRPKLVEDVALELHKTKKAFISFPPRHTNERTRNSPTSGTKREP